MEDGELNTFRGGYSVLSLRQQARKGQKELGAKINKTCGFYQNVMSLVCGIRDYQSNVRKYYKKFSFCEFLNSLQKA